MSLIRKGRQIRKLRPYAVLPAAIRAVSPGSSRSSASFSIAWFLRLGRPTLEHSPPDIENRMYFLRVKQFASVIKSSVEHALRPGIAPLANPTNNPQYPHLLNRRTQATTLVTFIHLRGEGTAMSFKEYIRHRRVTETPAGDFTKDARDDQRLPDINTWEELRSYVSFNRGDDKVVRAAKEVWKGYQAHLKRHSSRT